LALQKLDMWREAVLEGPSDYPEKKSLYAAMHSNAQNCFAGFGRHTITDFLHSINLHPSTPPHEVCKEEDTFQSFRTGLLLFLDSWVSKGYQNHVCTRNNDENPFGFHKYADNRFTQSFIKVFRKAFCLISVDTYTDLARRGMFDPYHVIGKPYIYSWRIIINFK
jgi:hypothetical protein